MTQHPPSGKEPSPSDSELLEEAFRGAKGLALHGESDVPPSFYCCPEHGEILAQDVIWSPGLEPLCPEANCRVVLTEMQGDRC